MCGLASPQPELDLLTRRFVDPSAVWLDDARYDARRCAGALVLHALAAIGDGAAPALVFERRVKLFAKLLDVVGSGGGGGASASNGARKPSNAEPYAGGASSSAAPDKASGIMPLRDKTEPVRAAAADAACVVLALAAAREPGYGSVGLLAICGGASLGGGGGGSVSIDSVGIGGGGIGGGGAAHHEKALRLIDAGLEWGLQKPRDEAAVHGALLLLEGLLDDDALRRRQAAERAAAASSASSPAAAWAAAAHPTASSASSSSASAAQAASAASLLRCAGCVP